MLLLDAEMLRGRCRATSKHLFHLTELLLMLIESLCDSRLATFCSIDAYAVLS